ncbi:MAG: hypothetical protein P8175_13830 [Deltaproteobacteria bacterium]
MKDTSIELDDAAQQLFQQLGGIAEREDHSAPAGTNGLTESLINEQKKQDIYRQLLIDCAHLLATYFRDTDLITRPDAEQACFRQLASALERLAQIPVHDGGVLIRFRGFPSDPDTLEKLDYEIFFANHHITTASVQGMLKRQGTKAQHLPDQLLNAFSCFSDHSVSNLYLRLDRNTLGAINDLRTCLLVLSRFNHCVAQNRPVTIPMDNQQLVLPVVYDNRGRPDANLTLVSGLNRLGQAKTTALIKKVDAWVRQKTVANPGYEHNGIYNTFFNLKQLRAKLKRPPLEMNNVKWLMVARDDEVISGRKAQLAQWIVDTSKDSPQKVAKVLTSVYGNDFHRITSQHLGERLHLSSDLLDSIESEKSQTELKDEVLGNIQSRLQTVKDHVFDDLQVEARDTATETGSKRSVLFRVNKHLYKMISFFKLRSFTRKKMQAMVNKPIEFSQQELATLAKDFRIELEKAQELIDTLKQCFSQQGAFNKRSFEQSISFFIKYERKIFEFLWHHLKDVVQPEDRIAFLNALQNLTARMNQPKRAFKILLEDFCEEPDMVNFSDSKALMLSNLVLRHYDKSLADFEITPEDIITDRSRLDEDVVRYASWRIDKEQERFFRKIRTIHDRLFESLSLGQTRHHQFTPDDMLGIERECYIFLALIGGPTARSVMRSAVKDYSSLGSTLYQSKHSDEHLLHIIQNLRLVIRSLGVIGNGEDLRALDVVKQNKAAFVEHGKIKKYLPQAKILQDWLDEAHTNITHQ